MMKKPVLLILAIVFLVVSFGLVGCGGDKKGTTETAQPAKQESLADLLGKSRNVPGLTYDYVMSSQEGQMTGKMWMAGKKIKSEMVIQNEKMVSIMDGDNSVAYTYVPSQNMAMKVAFDPAMLDKGGVDQYIKDLDTMKAKVLDTTLYEGVRCRVVQQEVGNIQTKMWLREDYGLPMRVEVTTPDGNKTVMEYKNLKVGALPADTFQLPAGVPVTDMSDLVNKFSKQP